MRRPGMLFVSMLATATIVFGAAAPAPAPTADSIVVDYIRARGGLAKIRSIQTLRQKGNAIGGAGREAVVLRELKRPGKSRFEFTVQGITGVFVVNGQDGWQVSPFSGDMSVQPMSKEALTDALEQADIEGPLVDWKAKGHQLELVGHAMVSGRDTYKLKLTLKSGAVRYDYIDVKTHYQLRTDSTREIRGLPVQIETTFGDHKMFQGVLFPRMIEVDAVHRPDSLKIILSSIEVNPLLSDARFERSTQAK